MTNPTPRETLLSRLPYELTDGVTATREGIDFYVADPFWMMFHIDDDDVRCTPDGTITLFWPDVRERLQYREGEPYAVPSGRKIVCFAAGINIVQPPEWEMPPRLSDLANMLVRGDAEAFRILHACINDSSLTYDEQQINMEL